MNSLLISNPAQIVSPRPGVRRGPGLKDPVIREGESILIKDGVIEAIGPLKSLSVPSDAKILDASARAVIPGFVDCHSHLVFGGNRADEFAMRTAGKSYAEIAAMGGGIARTVEATRSTPFSELFSMGTKLLNRAMSHGITTMEVKTGYGLDPETELKQLKLIRALDQSHPIDLVPTFLGAHSVPKGMTKDQYMAHLRDMIPEAAKSAKFCDVFCEEGYFTPAESIELLELAAKHGMRPKLHGNQFHSIGCVEAAVELGAVSIDHLEVLETKEIEMLAESDVVCVMLPGVSLFLDIAYAPARRIIDAGGIPAIATDFNPGSNMCMNMQLMLSVACMRMGVTVEEAIACATCCSAYALRLDNVGFIEPGQQADLLLLDTDDYRNMFYFYGENHVEMVIKKGIPHAVR